MNRSFNHRFRDLGGARVPEGAGDRYWSQDIARDHRYLQGLAARAICRLVGAESALLSGGTVTEGSSKSKVNVLAAVGVCSFSVEVPDDGVPWTVPAATKSDPIKVLASCPNVVDLQLGGTLNGVATNYVKLRFAEADGAYTRAREYASGSYSHTKVESYQLVANATPPTEYDVLLATYVGNGTSTLTITQAALQGVEPGALSVLRRDPAGRARVADPSAAGDAVNRGYLESVYTAAGVLAKLLTVDGPGSGLDADLFDGLQAERFIFGSNATGTSLAPDLNVIVKSGPYEAVSPYTGAPSANPHLVFHVQRANDTVYAFQITKRFLSTDTTNDTLYCRTRINGTWLGWVPLWNAANDGVGSGLDADLVRGLPPYRGSVISLSSPTLGAIYNSLSALVPNVNDYLKASGLCTTGSVNYINYIYRVSTTTIRIILYPGVYVDAPAGSQSTLVSSITVVY